MEAPKKELAPDWLGEGRCLITGTISSTYNKNRKAILKRNQRTGTNWGKHEEA